MILSLVPLTRAANPDPVLFTEVKRARRYFDALVSGRTGSVAELASLEGTPSPA